MLTNHTDPQVAFRPKSLILAQELKPSTVSLKLQNSVCLQEFIWRFEDVSQFTRWILPYCRSEKNVARIWIEWNLRKVRAQADFDRPVTVRSEQAEISSDATAMAWQDEIDGLVVSVASS